MSILRQSDNPNEVGPWLGAGIFFLPYVFAWVTLQRGFSNRARGASFTWLFCCLTIILLAILSLQWPHGAPPVAGGPLTTHVKVAVVDLPTQHGKIVVALYRPHGGQDSGMQFLAALGRAKDCVGDHGYPVVIEARYSEGDNTQLTWSDQPPVTCVSGGAADDAAWSPEHHSGSGGDGDGSFGAFGWSGPNFIEGSGKTGGPGGGGGGPGGGGPGNGGGPGGGGGPGVGSGPGPGSGPGDGPEWPSDGPEWPGAGPQGPGGGGDPPPFFDVTPSGSSDVIGGAPEPADWIILICGTFLLGWVIRRHRALPAISA